MSNYMYYDLFHNNMLQEWADVDGKKPASIIIAEHIQELGIKAYDADQHDLAKLCSKCINLITNLCYCTPVKELVNNMLNTYAEYEDDVRYTQLSNAASVMQNFA